MLIFALPGLLCMQTVIRIHIWDSFGVERILKEKFIGNKNIVTNICRMQAYNSVMCGYFVLDLLILSLKVKAWQTLLIYSHQTILKIMIK